MRFKSLTQQSSKPDINDPSIRALVKEYDRLEVLSKKKIFHLHMPEPEQLLNKNDTFVSKFKKATHHGRWPVL